MAEAADNTITSYFRSKRAVTLDENNDENKIESQEEATGEPEKKKQKLDDEGEQIDTVIDDDDDDQDTGKPETNKEDNVPQQEENDETIESTQVQNSQNNIEVTKQTVIKAALNNDGESLIKKFTKCDLKDMNKKAIQEGLKELHEHLKPKQGDQFLKNGETFTGNAKQKKTYERLIALKETGGSIPAKGVIGNMIYKELKENPTLKRPEEDAAAFRKRWLTYKIEQLTKECVMTESWRRVDTTKWIYYNFGQLVIKLGGWDDEAAIEGASNVVMECEAIGDPFVRTHNQTKMVMFALCEMEWAEIYEQAWAETKNLQIADEEQSNEEEQCDGDKQARKRPANAEINDRPLKQSRSSETIDVDANGSQQGDQQPGKDDEKKKETPEQKQRKDDAKMIREGMKIKSRYNLACERATKILDQIKTMKKENKYGWAKDNDDGDRKIMKYLNSCRSKLGDFETDFMLIEDRDFPDFKKKHGVPMILVKMNSIIDNLAKPIGALELVTQTIVDCTETLAKSKLKREKSEEQEDYGFFL